MKVTTFPYFLFLGFSFLNCKSDSKNTYAIRDFNKSLQPYLTKIVSKGIVGLDNSTKFIEKEATDEELKELSKSEHPILRAVAFRAMLDRPTFNHFEIIMNNLDDTATVATDAGEWGIQYLRISDDLLHHGTWKDTAAKNKTIEAVITKHNYLSSAYTILLDIQPNEKFYSYIKAMAQGKRIYDEEVGELAFNEIEYALYALAMFKKDEDVPIIKQLLLSNCCRMGDLSFRLMKEYPNEAYIEVYEKYYLHCFYNKICNKNTDDAISFIKSVASYKSEKSETILNAILNRKPFISCSADTNYLKEELSYAIWDNQCDSYAKVREQIKDSVKSYEKQRISIMADPIYFPPDTSFEPIRWR